MVSDDDDFSIHTLLPPLDDSNDHLEMESQMDN